MTRYVHSVCWSEIQQRTPADSVTDLTSCSVRSNRLYLVSVVSELISQIYCTIPVDLDTKYVGGVGGGGGRWGGGGSSLRHGHLKSNDFAVFLICYCSRNCI